MKCEWKLLSVSLLFYILYVNDYVLKTITQGIEISVAKAR